jgi:diguanylate cyclase (GGDEF)-like protein/PAS domain S-box-containing protein
MDSGLSHDKQDLFKNNQDSGQTENRESLELKQENRVLTELYEEAVTRTHTLTMEVEIARLEFEQVFNAFGDASWVLNNEYFILRINRAFLDLLGLKDRKTTLTQKCYELLNCPLFKTPDCPMEQIRKGKRRIELDKIMAVTYKGPIPFLLTAMPLFGLAGETIGLVEQFKDITERKRYEEALERANKELEHLAAIDGLTQLLNRRVFDEALEKEWRRMKRDKKPLSLILCDIDFFKLFNDHYGHQEGDDCLKKVASCIKSCVRRPGDLSARYGGEEFGVLLPDTNAMGAIHLAEVIRETVFAMKREHAHSKVSPVVTLSLGVATVDPPSEKSSAGQLLNAADHALYASKKAGRNRVTLDASF